MKYSLIADIMSLMESILVVRHPGSLGSQLVRNFVSLMFTSGWLDWEVKIQTFSQTTLWPHNEQRTFHNIIATQDPDKPRQLVLACHYDSKTDPYGFLGATDSAVPCAIIMHIAITLDTILRFHLYLQSIDL